MLLIYSPQITSRLEYTLNTLTKCLGLDYLLTNDLPVFEQYSGARLRYSPEAVADDAFYICSTPLLFCKGIKQQSPDVFSWCGQPAFFRTTIGDMPFDLFAASFYLLSRYEEYLPHKRDSYGRFAFENSVAWKGGFLTLPLINIWLNTLKSLLKKRYPELEFKESKFSFVPTYDVDIAWSYKNKDLIRTLGGGLKALLEGKWTLLGERINVLSGKEKDPFDLFDWFDELHKDHAPAPIFFMLVAARQKQYDKNISPRNLAFQELIKAISSNHKTGLHPSWQSGDEASLLIREKRTLESITGQPVDISRQHYIRFDLPTTFRQLISSGITDDYSMGYGSINDFRVSYCMPFFWYDLEKEEVTNLLLHPFCWMEANSYFEQHYTLPQAAEELEHYHAITRSMNGHLVTICHNHLLGNLQLFEGWAEMYKAFLKRHFSASRRHEP